MLLRYELPEHISEFICYTLPRNFGFQATGEVADPDLANYPQRISLNAGDGSCGLTLYYGETLLLECRDNDKSTFYTLKSSDPWDTLMEQHHRIEYLTGMRSGFSFNGTAGDALLEYAKAVFPTFYKNLAQDSPYRMIDYKFLSCNIVDSTETTAWGTLFYNFQPAQRFGPLTFDGLPIDNGAEGWYEALQNIAIELHPDGLWYPINDNDMFIATSHIYDPHPQNTIDCVAEAYLDSVQNLLSALPEDDAGQILETAQIFVQCVTAVPMSSSFDFDWSALCTEDAFTHAGMRSLWNLRIDNALYEGHLLTALGTEYPFDYLVISEDNAVLIASQIQIYLHKESGTWKIHDVSQPFAGT
jgi:hypothetical protein